MRLLPMLMLCLLLSPIALAQESSHRAAAERFLKLANADSMTAPLYSQTERLMTAQFAQMGGSMQYEAVLRDYRLRARALLDEQLGWEAIRDELLALYLPVFSEQEFNALSAFYQSPAGSKLLEHLPELTRGSMAIAQARVEQTIAPQLEQLVEDMGAEVEQRQRGKTSGDAR